MQQRDGSGVLMAGRIQNKERNARTCVRTPVGHVDRRHKCLGNSFFVVAATAGALLVEERLRDRHIFGKHG